MYLFYHLSPPGLLLGQVFSFLSLKTNKCSTLLISQTSFICTISATFPSGYISVYSLLNGLCCLAPFNLVVLLLSKLTGTQLRMDPEEQHRDLMIQEDMRGEKVAQGVKTAVWRSYLKTEVSVNRREREDLIWFIWFILNHAPCWLWTRFSTTDRD